MQIDERKLTGSDQKVIAVCNAFLSRTVRNGYSDSQQKYENLTHKSEQ